MDEARIAGTFEFFDATQLDPAERFERARWQCSWCDATAVPVATRPDKQYKVAAHFRIADNEAHADDCFNHADVIRKAATKGSRSRPRRRTGLVDTITFPDRAEADAAFTRISTAVPRHGNGDAGSSSSRRSIRAAAYIHRNGLNIPSAPLTAAGVSGATYWDVIRPVTRALPATESETRIWFGRMRAFEELREERDFIEVAFNCNSDGGGGYVRAVADTRDWGEYQRAVLRNHVTEKIALAQAAFRSGRSETGVPTIYVLGTRDRRDPCRIVFNDPRKFAIV